MKAVTLLAAGRPPRVARLRPLSSHYGPDVLEKGASLDGNVMGAPVDDTVIGVICG